MSPAGEEVVMVKMLLSVELVVLVVLESVLGISVMVAMVVVVAVIVRDLLWAGAVIETCVEVSPVDM